MNDLKDKLNPGHYLELMDRIHIIISTLDDHLIQHPLTKVERTVRNHLYTAVDALYDAYQEVGKLDYERNKT